MGKGKERERERESVCVPAISSFISVMDACDLSLIWGSLCFLEIQSLGFSWPFLSSVPRL